jgi:hypothetical protein
MKQKPATNKKEKKFFGQFLKSGNKQFFYTNTFLSKFLSIGFVSRNSFVIVLENAAKCLHARFRKDRTKIGLEKCIT